MKLLTLTVIYTLISTAFAMAETVSGMALYRERIAPPSGSLFVAVLEDISLADAPATVIGRAEITDAGNPPYRFQIEYDPAAIEPSHSYSVRTTLTAPDGTLLFSSDAVTPVLTRGAPNEVEIMMRRIASGGEPQPSVLGAHGLQLPATFTGTLPCADCEGIAHDLDLWPDQSFHLSRVWLGRDGANRQDEAGRWIADPARDAIVLRLGDGEVLRWKVGGPDRLRLLDTEGNTIESDLPYDLVSDGTLNETDLEGLFLAGMMTYMADAALFEECLTGRSYPVAMEQAYIEAERAYTGLQDRAPGAPVLAVLEGRLAERPSMEGPPRTHLVIERFSRLVPGRDCTGARADAAPTNTYWRILRIGEETVGPAEGRREPFVLLHAGETPAFNATVGCNMIRCGYTLEGDALSFGQAAMTMMACPPPLDERERALADAFADVAAWAVNGTTLELFDAGGARRLLAEAVYLP